jgi:hypothetical protein
MKPQVVVQQTTDATVLKENYPRTPTILGLRPAGLLRVVTVSAAPAVVVVLLIMVTLAAEAAAAGAPHTGLAGELVEVVIPEAEVTQTATKTNRISANGNPTLSTSVVVPGGLPRAIPVLAMPKTIQKDKNRIVEYNIYFITLIRVHLFGTCRVQVHRD